MRPIRLCCVTLMVTMTVSMAVTLASPCMAQEHEWEVGGAVGFGIVRNATITDPAGSVSAGIDNGLAAGAVIGQDLYAHLGGELRYTFRDNNLLLTGGGQKVSLSGDSHLVHYDLLFHALPKSSRFRPYAAAGGGIRLFRGTGNEQASQPLSDFAFLSKTQEVKPLISVGAGVKFFLTSHAALRVDFREYISPFPEQLFVPAPGAKIKGWLYDSLPLVGLSYVF